MSTICEGSGCGDRFDAKTNYITGRSRHNLGAMSVRRFNNFEKPPHLTVEISRFPFIDEPAQPLKVSLFIMPGDRCDLMSIGVAYRFLRHQIEAECR
jgi:hypothetical protein